MYFRVVMLFTMLAVAQGSDAQLIQGVSINTSGNTNYTDAILDLSNQNTTGQAGFLPPYVFLTNADILTTPITGGAPANLSGLVVYNTNTSTSNGLNGPGLYYWNNTLSTPSWVFLGLSTNSANNGLSVNGSAVQLGGSNLIQTTNIPLNGNKLSVQGSSDTTIFTSTGQVGVGNTNPDQEAIVDLTNATNLGFMLPGISAANLPAISNAQNGLVVYNTTSGCPEVAYNGNWYWFGISHGSLTDTSFAIMDWTVPLCVTSITIVAKGASGGGGGSGAIVTYTATVTPGEVLGLAAGQEGFNEYMGGGGGGGSFVWNTANTTTPIVAAGGGGGFGGYNASTTSTPNGDLTTNGAEGTGGEAGGEGSGVAGGGGGGGWNTTAALANPTTSTNQLGAGGTGLPNGFQGGAATTNCIKQSGQGGFGGGGGEGASTNANNYGGGGGGGGYNGGGGGDGTNGSNGEYGGAGGGSYVPAGATVTVGNVGNGSITITW